MFDSFTEENPAERFNDDFQIFTTKVDVGFTKKKWADQFYIGVLASDLKKGVQTGQTMGSVYGRVRINGKTLNFDIKHLFKSRALTVTRARALNFASRDTAAP